VIIATIATVASAFWLGVLTSISPCPLATNIAAVSYVGRESANPRRLLGAGLLYTIGRAATYALVGGILATGLIAAFEASTFLQTTVPQLVGPILIVIGVVVLGLVAIPLGNSNLGARFGERFGALGAWGALPLGALFALSFCPVSAALFFGGLLPLATRASSAIVLPLVYGIGTAIPVVVFAVAMAFGARSLAGLFTMVTRFDRWIRGATGVVLIGVGIYLTLTTVFRVALW
jgi:cytochrome c biogenesis protein CcdA